MDQEELIELIILACLMAPGVCLAVFLWRKGIGWLMAFLPPQRRRAVPWELGEVFVSFLVLIFAPVFTLIFLVKAGFFDWVYGPGVARQVLSGGPQNQAALYRCLPWATLAALPFQVAAIVLFLHLVSGTRLYQVGLTRHRLVRNIGFGTLAWLLVTPVILLINVVILLLYRLSDLMPEKHPVEVMAKQIQTPAEWVVLALVATVAAPVIEELLFRGVLQPWAMKRLWGADLAMAGSLGIILIERAGKLLDARSLDRLLIEMQPVFFVLLMTIPYLAIRWRTAGPSRKDQDTAPPPIEEIIVLTAVRSEDGRDMIQAEPPAESTPSVVPASGLVRITANLNDPALLRLRGGPDRWSVPVAIYAVSVLFAAFHSSVWPSPIALVPLGLVLGWLAYRTQSLVASMTLHMLFNSVSVVALMFSQPEAGKGKDETMAPRRPPVVSTSSFVPGS